MRDAKDAEGRIKDSEKENAERCHGCRNDRDREKVVELADLVFAGTAALAAGLTGAFLAGGEFFARNWL